MFCTQYIRCKHDGTSKWNAARTGELDPGSVVDADPITRPDRPCRSRTRRLAMDATITASDPTDPNLTSDTPDDKNEHDLIGGPFAVIESDPGVFTTLVRTLGVQGLQVVELYDIEPWASDHLHPIYGLVFCFLWRKDNDLLPKKEYDIPGGGDQLWFANQLSDDACASMAILNVLLNVEEIDVGEELRVFRNETEGMSSEVCPVLFPPLVVHLNPVAVGEGFGGFKCPFHQTST